MDFQYKVFVKKLLLKEAQRIPGVGLLMAPFEAWQEARPKPILLRVTLQDARGVEWPAIFDVSGEHPVQLIVNGREFPQASSLSNGIAMVQNLGGGCLKRASGRRKKTGASRPAERMAVAAGSKDKTKKPPKLKLNLPQSDLENPEKLVRFQADVKTAITPAIRSFHSSLIGEGRSVSPEAMNSLNALDPRLRDIPLPPISLGREYPRSTPPPVMDFKGSNAESYPIKQSSTSREPWPIHHKDVPQFNVYGPLEQTSTRKTPLSPPPPAFGSLANQRSPEEHEVRSVRVDQTAPPSAKLVTDLGDSKGGTLSRPPYDPNRKNDAIQRGRRKADAALALKAKTDKRAKDLHLVKDDAVWTSTTDFDPDSVYVEDLAAQPHFLPNENVPIPLSHNRFTSKEQSGHVDGWYAEMEYGPMPPSDPTMANEAIHTTTVRIRDARSTAQDVGVSPMTPALDQSIAPVTNSPQIGVAKTTPHATSASRLIMSPESTDRYFTSSEFESADQDRIEEADRAHFDETIRGRNPDSRTAKRVAKEKERAKMGRNTARHVVKREDYKTIEDTPPGRPPTPPPKSFLGHAEGFGHTNTWPISSKAKSHNLRNGSAEIAVPQAHKPQQANARHPNPSSHRSGGMPRATQGQALRSPKSQQLLPRPSLQHPYDPARNHSEQSLLPEGQRAHADFAGTKLGPQGSMTPAPLFSKHLSSTNIRNSVSEWMEKGKNVPQRMSRFLGRPSDRAPHGEWMEMPQSESGIPSRNARKPMVSAFSSDPSRQNIFFPGIAQRTQARNGGDGTPGPHPPHV